VTEAKFRPAEMSVGEFLTSLDDPQKRADSQTLVKMMSRLTGKKPKMWGYGIVGFGEYHYKYASGREGDSPLAAFSPRKAEFSIYLDAHESHERAELLSRLGKHRMGKGCLYVKRLDQVDLAVLEELVSKSLDTVRTAYPPKLR
jgi:hypothetical protein